MSNKEGRVEDYVPRLEQLLALAKAGDSSGFSAHLDDLTSLRELALFQDVGRLTRQLHESLMSFQFDSRVAALAASEFPDARNRLDRVIELTESSAHRTMDLIESVGPVVDDLQSESRNLLGQWQAASQPDAGLIRQTRGFVSRTAEQAETLRQALSDVLIAQNFQDLSGQIIRDIIRLVKEVEETLVNMIRLSGRSVEFAEQHKANKQKCRAADRVNNQNDVDDILSSLGF